MNEHDNETATRDFARILKDLRESMQLTQEEFGGLLKVTRHTVMRWEQEKALAKKARHLEVIARLIQKKLKEEDVELFLSLVDPAHLPMLATVLHPPDSSSYSPPKYILDIQMKQMEDAWTTMVSNTMRLEAIKLGVPLRDYKASYLMTLEFTDMHARNVTHLRDYILKTLDE